MHSNVNRGPANSVGRDMEAIFGPLSAESRGATRQLLAIDLKQRPRSAARWLVPAASFTLIMMILGMGIASKKPVLPGRSEGIAAAQAEPVSSSLQTKTASAAAAPHSSPASMQTSSDSASAASIKKTDASDRIPPQQTAARSPLTIRGNAEQRGPTAEAESPDPNQSCVDVDDSALYDCMHPHILRADRELRRAYARAVDDGVSEHILYRYQARWARLLEQAYLDPSRVTTRLGSMARQLDDERTGL